jgi:hypothetical protein
VSLLKIKISVKNIGRQRCAEGFNFGVKGIKYVGKQIPWLDISVVFCVMFGGGKNVMSNEIKRGKWKMKRSEVWCKK